MHSDVDQAIEGSLNALRENSRNDAKVAQKGPDGNFMEAGH